MQIPENAKNQGNLHYYAIGLGPGNGETVFAKTETLNIKTLETIMKENGDFGKKITYLKLDIEGFEIWSMPNFLKSDIFKNVDQIGVEMHTGNGVIDQTRVKLWYPKMVEFFREIGQKYGLKLAAYAPNLCVGKSWDANRKFYSYHDLLFVK